MRCKTFCKFADPFLTDGAVAGLTIIIASLGLLTGAYYFEHVVGLEPCILCMYQRAPHAAAIIFGFAAYLLAHRMKRQKAAALIIFLCAIIYAVSAGLGLYHAGVEQHWWVSAFEACSAPGIHLGSGDLLKQLEQTQAVRCDSIPWQMFGISMAGYNAILSAGLALYSLAAALLITRRANGI